MTEQCRRYFRRSVFAASVMLASWLGGCTSTEPVPIPVTAPGDTSGAAVVRRTLPETLPSTSPAVAPGTRAPAVAMAPVLVPADAIYVCVADTDGQRRQTAITFVPKVEQLCRRHPEMGPCQYERDICRRSGGRVFAAGGTEITMATEAEYDKKVMRVRFKAN